VLRYVAHASFRVDQRCCLPLCFIADGEPIPLDDAGNPLLGDIGLFLKKAIKTAIPDATLKYIDPTYMVQVREVLCTQVEVLFYQRVGRQILGQVQGEAKGGP
jgi:hypothetical protein